MRTRVTGILRLLGLQAAARRIYRNGAGYIRDSVWRFSPRSVKEDNCLPVPPPSLCFLAADSYDPLHFLSSGRKGAVTVRRLLQSAGRPLVGFRSVLDFGCGCGRIARHMRDYLEGISFIGTDIDPVQVRWVRGKMPPFDFTLTGPSAALPFPDGNFDLVLAVAVFPWLDETAQLKWMEELGRVLEPGGVLLVTLKGENRRGELSEEQLEAFDSGCPVVIEPGSSGTRYCLSYNPESYVRHVLADGFDVLLFSPGGSEDTNQDAWVLTRSCGEAAGTESI